MRRQILAVVVITALAIVANYGLGGIRWGDGGRRSARAVGRAIDPGRVKASTAPGTKADILDLGRIFVVTEDWANLPEPGCDAVSILTAADGVLRLGTHYISPGRITGNRDLSLIVANQSNVLLDPHRDGTEPGDPGLYVTRCPSRGLASCQDTILYTSPWIYSGGGIALASDGYTLLVTTDHNASRVSKFDLRNVDWDRRWLGPELSYFIFGMIAFDARGHLSESTAIAAEIVFSDEDRVAHVLLQPDYFPGEATVHSLNVASMQPVASPIPVPVNHQGFDDTRDQAPPSHQLFHGVRISHATLSVDERFLVLNNWALGSITVVDLRSRESWAVPIPGFSPARTVLALDFHAVAGVAANQADGANRGLLAIHGIDRVGVFALSDDGRHLEQRALEPVTPQFAYRNKRFIGQWGADSGPVGAIAWTGDGTHLVAAGAADGREEFQSWRVEGAGTALVDRHTYEVCSHQENNGANDIFTLNGLLPTPTPVATRAGDPTAVATPTPAPSSTVVASPTASRTPSPTVTATVLPHHVCLPVVLLEQCSPADRATRRFSVILVLDASMSMGEPTGDSSGRTKLAAAQEAIPALLDALDLPAGDRVGLITFNANANLAQVLTSERALVERALARVILAAQSRLDLGIRAAAEELTGPRRGIGYERIVVILTDGQATGDPAAAVNEAQRAKSMGLTFFTIGLGGDADLPTLARIASRVEYSYFAPSAPELGGIFGRIGRLLPCPPDQFWGRR